MKKDYRDLTVWQKAIDFAPNVYRLIRKLPKEETFALGAQMRRAVISVPSNIAEGQARGHRKEFIQHLNIAKGSLAELHTQLIVAQRLDYLTPQEVTEAEKALEEVGRLLNGLINSLGPTEN
jgi:four helix bundle protein